jgi:ABC-type branched-subunit amino acid transport system ATPase component
MSNQRNYTDNALEIFANDLSEGEQTMLVVGGALPADPFKDLEPNLRGSDIARMIEIIQED